MKNAGIKIRNIQNTTLIKNTLIRSIPEAQGDAKRHVKSETHHEQTQPEQTSKPAYRLIRLIPIPNMWTQFK